MLRRAGLLEAGDVAEGGFGDVGQSLVGEEGLVAGDQHVGEGEEPGEDVVAEDVVRQIPEEQIAFFLVDIEGERADPAILERPRARRAWSITAPREVFAIITPGFIFAIASVPIRCRVCGVSGQCREMMSDCANSVSRST